MPLVKISANVLSVILSFLDAKEIGKLSRVNKLFNKAGGMNYIWKCLCMKRWLFTRFEGTWKQSFLRKFLTGERMLRGNAKDYKMVPCRGHTSHVTDLLCIKEKFVSLSVNGEIFVWAYPEYTPIRLDSMYIGKLNVYQDKLMVTTSDGILQLWELDYMNLEFSHQIRLEETRICTWDNWVCLVGVTFGVITGIAINIATNKICEVNYTQRAFPEHITSQSITANNFTLYCGFANSVILWNWKNDTLQNFSLIGNSVCSLYGINDKIICFRQNYIETYSLSFEKLKSKTVVLNQNLIGIHDFNGLKVVAYFAQEYDYRFGGNNTGRVELADINTLDVVATVQMKSVINSLFFNAYHFIVGTVNNSIHVHETRTGVEKYVLLGGSMNPKTMPKSFVPHPTLSGCSKVLIDNERIVGVFGNLIRIYHFDLD